mmetsp:Transcript_2417/g.4655  ORF Transcript_2417/g.4655 Transcript_2417/m.4655 type:complete len:102 (-) Transcript_2417:567-872(-)
MGSRIKPNVNVFNLRWYMSIFFTALKMWGAITLGSSFHTDALPQPTQFKPMRAAILRATPPDVDDPVFWPLSSSMLKLKHRRGFGAKSDQNLFSLGQVLVP